MSAVDVAAVVCTPFLPAGRRVNYSGSAHCWTWVLAVKHPVVTEREMDHACERRMTPLLSVPAEEKTL